MPLYCPIDALATSLEPWLEPRLTMPGLTVPIPALAPALQSWPRDLTIRRWKPRRRVEILPESGLVRLLAGASCIVTVLHGRSIDLLGRVSRSRRDSHDTVQAIEAEDEAFLRGVEWHREFLLRDRGQRALHRAPAAAAQRS